MPAAQPAPDARRHQDHLVPRPGNDDSGAVTHGRAPLTRQGAPPLAAARIREHSSQSRGDGKTEFPYRAGRGVQAALLLAQRVEEPADEPRRLVDFSSREGNARIEQLDLRVRQVVAEASALDGPKMPSLRPHTASNGAICRHDDAVGVIHRWFTGLRSRQARPYGADMTFSPGQRLAVLAAWLPRTRPLLTPGRRVSRSGPARNGRGLVYTTIRPPSSS